MVCTEGAFRINRKVRVGADNHEPGRSTNQEHDADDAEGDKNQQQETGRLYSAEFHCRANNPFIRSSNHPLSTSASATPRRPATARKRLPELSCAWAIAGRRGVAEA